MDIKPESLFEKISQDNEVLNEFKDHSLRVMYLSSMLAHALDCYDEDLRIGALLHDIGKVGIAKEIILKAAPLSSIERRIIESHSHLGDIIVREELGNSNAATYIRDHHENWDGSGYPRGLVGEEISVQGRIIRLCEAFDVITYSSKNYKRIQMTHDEACEELSKCSWRQFDGFLVNAFISMVKEINLPEQWYEIYGAGDLWNRYSNK